MSDVIRLLTYNIQIAIAAQHRWQHLSRSWHHFLPHRGKLENLLNIAEHIRDYDIVCLQELDAGSFRSHHINQLDYLAHHAKFAYAHGQTTRHMGRLAQHSKGILSHLPLVEAQRYALPSRIPGRGVQICRVKIQGQIAHVFNVHLSLSKKTQLNQLAYLVELAATHDNVIMMGDFNVPLQQIWQQSALKHTPLQLVTQHLPTYPSWQPKRALDAILLGPSFQVLDTAVLRWPYSDHCAVACEARLKNS